MCGGGGGVPVRMCTHSELVILRSLPLSSGKKNFLPPCQLVLGFGFLFRVSRSTSLYFICIHVFIYDI